MFDYYFLGGIHIYQIAGCGGGLFFVAEDGNFWSPQEEIVCVADEGVGFDEEVVELCCGICKSVGSGE